MTRVRIIPVLLLHNGGLYKTVQFKNAAYIGDPVNTVRIFNEKEADELMVLDYRATKENKAINFSKIEEMAGEAFMPMAYGGGIKSFEEAKKVFDAGYEKIVLSSILFSKPQLVTEIANVYGAQAVIGCMDIKKNIFGKHKLYTHSGTVNTGHGPVDWAKNVENMGVGEIMMNSIDSDGSWNGYDELLIEKVSQAVSVPLIACGGAGNLQHMKNAVVAGASAVAAGSMFVYQKKGKGVLISFPSEIINK